MIVKIVSDAKITAESPTEAKPIIIANAISLPIPAKQDAEKPWWAALLIERRLFGPGARFKAKQAGTKSTSVEKSTF